MLVFHFIQVPILAQMKEEGDKRFRARDYKKAAEIYLTAINYPIPQFLEVSAVSEQLRRRRAECLYEMVS